MPYPSLEIDALIGKGMDQAFAEQREVFRHAQTEASAGNDKVAELTRNAFLNINTVAQATIADALLNGGLAKDILSQRSAGGQPNAAGGPQNQANPTPQPNAANP